MATADAFFGSKLVLRIMIHQLLLNIMSTMFVTYPGQQGLFVVTKVLKILTLRQYNAILELSKTTASLAITVSSMESLATSNQRIESWWRQLRRSCADWWISYFKDLEYRGLFCNEDIIHVECLQFCFMSILQNELHEAAKLWNTHVIRPSHNEHSPSGRPDTLYCIPEATGTVNYLVNLENADIELVDELCSVNSARI